MMLDSSKPWPAPAKLNLFLHITSQRDDGYHELQTIFQFIDWCDYLTFDVNTSGKIAFHCSEPLFNNDDNLVVKAAKLLQAKSNKKVGVTINLQKNLPSGAGLGGGSSDAATTLVALNQLWSLALSNDDLQKLGLSLGADVPIFIYGKACWAEGIGERFSDFSVPEATYYLINPKESIATPALFASKGLKRDCERIEKNKLAYSALSNVFERVVEVSHPAMVANVQAQVAQLKKQGVDATGSFLEVDYRMTGSGSTFFAPLKEGVCLETIKSCLPIDYGHKVVKTQNMSALNFFFIQSKKNY